MYSKFCYTKVVEGFSYGDLNVLNVLVELDDRRFTEVLKAINKRNVGGTLHLHEFAVLKPLLSKFIQAKKIDSLMKLLKVKDNLGVTAYGRFSKEQLLSLLEDARGVLSAKQYLKTEKSLTSLATSAGCIIC